MKKTNKFGEQFYAPDKIIERIKSIAFELNSNFAQYNSIPESLNLRFLLVSDFYKKDNPKRVLRDFAKNLDIKIDNNTQDFSGVYVFAQKNQDDEFNFLYTGISRNIIERVNSHVNRTDSGTATWAYQMAKSKFQTKKNGSNVKIPKNEIKLKISEMQGTEIAKCYVSFIHEPDNFIMHIAEGYVACTLECEWNSFKTH